MIDDIFNKHARPGQHGNVQSLRSEPPTAKAPETIPDKIPYQAAENSRDARPERRFLLRFQDGSWLIMNYAYLSEVQCSSDRFLTLIFTHCIVTLKGYNLNHHTVLDGLLDEKIRSLQCFHPDIHQKPTDRDQPIIVEMSRETLEDAREA